MFAFRVLKKDKKNNARLGVLKTPHGLIKTPAFVPVATKGALRGISFEKTKKVGADVFMINTFHFFHNQRYLLVKKFNGLHHFLKVYYPLMTDSGGFQVFSLGFGLVHGVGKIANIFPLEKNNFFKKKPTKKSFIKINDEGIEFKSPWSGQKLFLSPELSIKIQKILGADIIFAFDECTSPLAGYEYTQRALLRTHLWAERSLKEFFNKKDKNHPQVMLGIIQGGEYKDLREKSVSFIRDLPFFGFAIGGSLGKTKKDMLNVLDWTLPFLPFDKPRHLLGIGEIEDIFEATARGVDLFDCVIPTRLARHETALTSFGKINLKSAKYLNDKKPLDVNCQCFVCQNYSRAYLSHLVKEKEINSVLLLTEHNLFFVLNLMKNIRKSLKEGNFSGFKTKFLKNLKKNK